MVSSRLWSVRCDLLADLLMADRCASCESRVSDGEKILPKTRPKANIGHLFNWRQVRIAYLCFALPVSVEKPVLKGVQQRTTFRPLFRVGPGTISILDTSWKWQKKFSFRELFHETAEICCSKTCVKFRRCYGRQGWAAEQ